MSQNPDLDPQMQRALSEIADDLAGRSESIRFDPNQLMQRIGDPTMNNVLNDLFVNPSDDSSNPATPSPVTPNHKPSRRRAGSFRFALGALSGLLVAGGAFAIRERRADQANVQVGKQQASPPYLLKTTSIPQDLCLQHVLTFEDADQLEKRQQQARLFTRSDGAKLKVGYDMDPYSPANEPIAETVQINGRRGLLSTQKDQLLLTWQEGQTNVALSASKMSAEEVVSIAQSVRFTYDENGAKLSGIDAPGFVKGDVAELNAFPDSRLNFGECKRPFVEDGRSLSVMASPKGAAELDGIFGGLDSGNQPEMIETAVTVTREGKEVDAMRKVAADPKDKDGFVFISWFEANSWVSVAGTQLSEEELLSVAAGLEEATLEEFEQFRKRTNQVVQPGIGKRDRSEDQTAGVLETANGELTVRTAVSEDKLCVTLSTPRAGSGLPCKRPGTKPWFTKPWTNDSIDASQAIAEVAVVKAVALMPDGTSLDIPSFQDSRLPSVRVFVLVTPRDGPVPKKITFFDADGKTVNTQSGRRG
jgi:hypothetical protein